MFINFPAIAQIRRTAIAEVREYIYIYIPDDAVLPALILLPAELLRQEPPVFAGVLKMRVI